MASEVTSDLEFELSGLKNLGSSASLASFVLYSTKCPEERKEGRKETKSTCRLALLRMLVKMGLGRSKTERLNVVCLQFEVCFLIEKSYRWRR